LRNQGGTQGDTTEKSSEKSSQKSSQKILELVAADDKITTQEMANKLGISRRAVAKTIAKLQSAGILRRVGPDKGGHWEIIPTER
jgi:ATP-dependent DNA helicase RecG